MTQPKLKIKKGDTVMVMTGSDKGAVGAVVRVSLAEQKVWVENVRQFKRPVKASQLNPEGVKNVHHPIHVSNVALVDSQGNPQKVGYKINDEGKKVRYFKKTGELV